MYKILDKILYILYSWIMALLNPKIVPVSEARNKLASLLDLAKGDKLVLLTKGGKPKVALVDIVYLEKLQEDLRLFYQQTFIDPKLLPLTRKFSDEEMGQWLEEDKL